MLVPRAGWAEHRATEDWWGDFTAICREILEKSRVDPAAIRAVGCSGIGPCMLPVDRDGEPLMNAVLYGVDTRAADEIEELTREIGAGALMEPCGNALTSQSAGPKFLWLRPHHPEPFTPTPQFLNSYSVLVPR